ncbi:MAG: substrate-binding domain-containing protein [Actinobacteria bacterium]|nr:substrate-binding domain-containing protein [Actinomycetota bacterium]
MNIRLQKPESVADAGVTFRTEVKIKVTTTDIAKLAGVSQSTVSRVLNEAPIRISPARKRKILALAEKLNYTPNRSARTLKMGKHQVIAVMAYDITDAFAVECISMMESYLAEKQYRAEWISCAYARRQKVEPKRMLAELAQSVDGMIVIEADRALKDADLLKFWASTNIPMVTVIRRIPGDMISSVTLDDEAGTTRLVEHLVELGHKRIAFCYHRYKFSGDGLSCHPTAARRHEVFKRLIKQHGLGEDPDLQIAVDDNPKDGYEAGRMLISGANLPTAIIAFKDLIAMGLIKACYDHGINIPGNMSIASFDNIRIAEITSPALTTVAANYAEIARLSIDELIRQIENAAEKPFKASHYVSEPELIIRESTMPRQQ